MRQHVLLAVGCLLAVAALASADNCSQPNGTACPPNTEYRQTGKGKNKAGSCVACSLGQYTPTLGLCCKPCNNGVIFTDPVSNMTTCVKCPGISSTSPKPGSRSQQQATTCMCPAGYQATGTSSVTGVTGCAKCPPGSFSNAPTISTEACKPCAAGSVAPKNGTKVCTVCRNNSTASIDQQECVCPVNYYVKSGRSRTAGRNSKSGRRLSGYGVWAGSVSTADGEDEYKAPSCLQCASQTQNMQQNTWPVCCEAGQAYNNLTKKCELTICYDGAKLVNQDCVCAGGIAVYVDGWCSCYDNAVWNNSTKDCICGDGADYNLVVGGSPNVRSCQCADGASWTSTNCDCGAVNVTWDPVQKKCVCPSGLAWDATNGVCICSSPATWDPTSGACV